MTNESLITRARNTLVREFLNTDATHLFFIDADIRFDALDALRLLLHNKPVVTATYPMKTFNVENLVGKKFDSVEDIHMASAKYVTNFVFENEEAKKEKSLKVVEGLIEIYDAGTGFMCIKREVIERLIQEYSETEYFPEGSKTPSYSLFDTLIDEDKRYLSEDYTFCRRWQKIGGRVWLDPQVVLDHFGSVLFRGQNFLILG
jgi:GT2 family glycosyltransferase